MRAETPAPTNGKVIEHDIANRLFFRLYQASNLMHKTGTNAVSGVGATTQQWAVLGALAGPRADEGELSIKQLMEYLMISRQSLTAILDRLERSGLVQRDRAGGDGRIRNVSLTPKGQSTWKELQPKIRAFYGAALADFSVEESYLLMLLLDRLSAGLAKL